MTRTRILLLIASALTVAPAHGGSIEDHAQFREQLQAGVTAFEARDYAQAEESFRAAVNSEPQQPRAIYNLAAATAARGNGKQALQLLDRYVAMGVKGNQDLGADFPTLTASPDFARIKERFAQNGAPSCPCSTVFEGDAAPFLAEGVAVDGERIFVSAINARKIVAITAGKATDFVATLPDGLSPLGLAIGRSRTLLWVAAASMPQSQGATARERGRSALLAFDLKTGAQRSYLRTPPGVDSAFGDLALAGDGTVYISDSRGGLFRLDRKGSQLEPFGAAGTFASPQGIAVRSDDRYAVVADYALGLQRVDLASAVAVPIKVAATVTTLGIDGIAQLEDGSFVATQNGLAPMRIVRFRLSADWSEVSDFSIVARASGEISDLTLVAADGNSVVLTGISQWASFDETGTAPARPLARWKLVRLTLPARGH